MKIATTHSGVRGVASYILYAYRALEKEGMSQLIVSEAKWQKESIPVFEPRSKLLLGFFPWVCDIREVEKKLKEFAPDILHHNHPSGRLDFMLDRLRKKLDVPLVITFHNPPASKKYWFEMAMHLHTKMARRNMLKAQCHIAVSKYVKNQLDNLGMLQPQKNILLYAGIDTETFRPMPYQKHDTLEIVFIGAISYEKGIGGLINVVIELAKVRKVRLSILGQGNSKLFGKDVLEDVLKNKIGERPEINWIGYIPETQRIAEYCAKADVLVLPSLWDEALPLVLLEALSAGTAVIAADGGGSPEVVRVGETGYVFEKGNFKKLFDLLKIVNIEKLWEMGSNGRNYVLKHHTLELFGQKYRSLYENVLNCPDNIKQID